MCLSNITKRYSKKDKTEGYGYKIVNKNWPYYIKNRLYYGYVAPLQFKPLPLNKWIKRRISNISSNYEDLFYESGFHIFKTKKDAERHWINNRDGIRTIIKVKYKGIICEGYEHFLDDNSKPHSIDVLVVKQIFIET